MAPLPNDLRPLSEKAPAKINLDLRVTGRRSDGYHLLDSLVVFASIGDVLDYSPSDNLSYEITGPFSQGLEMDENNLVSRAVRAFAEVSGLSVTGRFVLSKNLPVASGIGGGSADAAATLRILNKLFPDSLASRQLEDIALTLGADVPACLKSRSLRMRSVGEEITPVGLDFPLYILLANPGVQVETATIFRALKESGRTLSDERKLPARIGSVEELIEILRNSTNDLQDPACSLVPEISRLLTEMKKLEGGLYTAMSGSGATCFTLFATKEDAKAAHENLLMDSKNYWVEAGKVL